MKSLQLYTKKLIVVLGMHRSGTSATTRALEVLGVELGDRMMPAIEGNNAKGFWEDIDLNALNIEMLQALGSNWHHLVPVTTHDAQALCRLGFELRAVELLRAKLANVPVFGFKDPRVAKLLPFWRKVFAHCQIEVGYVLPIRHPRSVFKSLQRRDGMGAEQSYLLWLGHVLQSLSDSADTNRILLDFDSLMQSPARELGRIARQFDLKINLEALQRYETSYLDQSLRHTVYDLSDLSLDRDCPPMVGEVYADLLEVACDKVDLDDAALKEKIDHWASEFERMTVALRLIDAQAVQISALVNNLQERETHIGNLSQTLIAREAHIGNLNQAVVERDALMLERDARLASLNQEAVLRDQQIGILSQTLTAREAHIGNLNQAAAERDAQIGALEQAALLLDQKNGHLNQALSANEAHIVHLNHVTTNHTSHIDNLDQTVAELNQSLAALKSSYSWRLSKPLRVLADLFLSGHASRPALKGLQKIAPLAHRAYLAATHDHAKLPAGFDSDIYLKLNPDLAASGMDPTIHYMLHGSHEGRTYSLPSIDNFDHGSFKVDMPVILVVSHEASRTGAPVLSLNLVQSLVGQYNVVVLLLGGGPLTDSFRGPGTAVITMQNLRGNQALANLVIGQLCARFAFRFALINSIESRVVLPPLAEFFVPTVSLVHEFASYTRPRDAFRSTLLWSGEVVFSAQVTLANAFAQYPDLVTRVAHILPQGRSLLPDGGLSNDQLLAASTHLRRLIRPEGLAEDAVIVLGAGFVQLRKGVDLFIECAARVRGSPGGNKCRFVWIGKGYDPENDVNYSVYLADQIRRAGLEDDVVFIEETSAIETAYEEADVLLLSSRLDPLPNVAIDAMAHGVPVVCFDKTTGIADFLTSAGVQDHCVAAYLDSSDMAQKLLALAASRTLRESVADQCRQAAAAYFSMKDYVARLDQLAQALVVRTQQEKADTLTILDSGLFRPDFACPLAQQGDPLQSQVRAYVRAWASGIDRRKPRPGFHPGIYLEQHGVAISGADPFADFIRAGQPDGVWNHPVIMAGTVQGNSVAENLRVALHLHVYYPELLAEIVNRLAVNKICPDLFISMANEHARPQIVSELKNYKGRVVDIQLVPNCGRDIGPLLTAFGPRLVADYDVVGHIHTKMSANVKDAAMGKTWYRFLLENLLGGESGAMADAILTKMGRDSSIGLAFPDDPYVVGMCANRVFAEKLAARMGFQTVTDNFVFPVGTMFWARASALAPFVNLNLAWSDYPEEPLPYDGSVLHALERLFSLSLEASHLKVMTTNVMGLTR